MTAKRAGAETRIHRGYPISELWEFIATPSPRACCRGAAAGSGFPNGLNYCRDPPKPSKLLVPATDQHLEYLKDANASIRNTQSRIPSNLLGYVRLPDIPFSWSKLSRSKNIGIANFFQTVFSPPAVVNKVKCADKKCGLSIKFNILFFSNGN